MDFLNRNIWFLLFLLWGIPLGYYRSKFRKMIYQTDSWTINVKPVFGKELRGLFGNLYPHDLRYKKFRNFYLFYLGVYFFLFIAYLNFNANTTVMKRVSIGSTIPKFELTNQHGQVFSIDSVLGKKNLVIYFYPKDYSPGCTREACSFRDQFEVFADEDAMIIGINSQSRESHLAFATKHRLTFTLLSDEGNRVRKLFGVPGNLLGLIPGRVSYVINKDGKVVYIFDSQFQAGKHVSEALRILKEMK